MYMLNINFICAECIRTGYYRQIPAVFLLLKLFLSRSKQAPCGNNLYLSCCLRKQSCGLH